MFQQIITSMTKDVSPTLTNTKPPFYITVESSVNVIGCVLIQMNNKRKMDESSCMLRLFTTSEQKHCTTYREVT